MTFVNYDIHASREQVLLSLKENDLIVEQEKLASKKGIPRIHIFEKGSNKLKITCEYIGGQSKDNAFLEGTYFIGRLIEKNDVAIIKGIILTAPIYHSIIALLLAFFVYQCISVGGFTPVPIIAFFFSIYMYWYEFKKQKIIKKYIFRALKNTFAKINKKSEQKK